MNRETPFAIGEYYHLYNRGVDKRQVFLTKEDHDRFMRLLYVSQGVNPIVLKTYQGHTLKSIPIGERMVAIGAYVLMLNHFHILVKETTENGITEFMRKLTTGYTMYFNKKNKRSGALFQGTFKAQHVNYDEYLKYLYAYIHLNPVKMVDRGWEKRHLENKIISKNHLENYQYSSYLDYVGIKREESVILNPKEFPEYFSNNGDFEEYIKDWMEPPELK